MHLDDMANLIDQALPLITNPETRASCTIYQEKIAQGEVLTATEIQTFAQLLLDEMNMYEGKVQWYELQIEQSTRIIEELTDTISKLNKIALRAKFFAPISRSFLNMQLHWTQIQLQWTQKILQQLLHKEGQLRQNMENILE
ncbi:MAG: hypothetical protein EBS29_11970 [Chloroflexia bacterium]|nr:hypothetical protein [Chloroflexia bacterium]